MPSRNNMKFSDSMLGIDDRILADEAYFVHIASSDNTFCFGFWHL